MGDILLVFDVGGVLLCVFVVIDEVYECEMIVVVLMGGNDYMVVVVLFDIDILISVFVVCVVCIYEVYLLIIYSLCDGIDVMLLGED